MGDITTEYGCMEGFRVLNSSSVSLTDDADDEIKCECGKKAVYMVAGEHSFKGWCEDCYPFKEEEE